MLTSIFPIAASFLRLRFGYTRHDGDDANRHVEPQRLIAWGSVWYLLAWDLDRDDWRIFRVDRMSPRPPTGVCFTPHEISEQDAIARVVDSVTAAATAVTPS